MPNFLYYYSHPETVQDIHKPYTEYFRQPDNFISERRAQEQVTEVPQAINVAPAPMPG